MICISDILGNITTVLPESLHQGSRGVNKIVLLAPFPSSAAVSVFLTLPNGRSLYPVLAEGADPNAYKMAAVDVALGVQKDGVDLNAWAYTIKAPVTEYSGTLTVQFSITMTDGQLTTSAVNLPISRGVPTLSPTVTEEDLAKIDAYLAAAQVAATAAQQSAGDAADAATSAVNAESSATDAASNAATSESNAATSESNAATSESNAATSAGNAATSESNAATSETNAANSEKKAALWATGEYTTVDEDGNETTVTAQEGDPQYQNNAKYYADKAERAEDRFTTRFSQYINQIKINTKRIENLETFDFFVTDDTKAYQKTVPTRSAKYAVINRLSTAVTEVVSKGANLLDSGALDTTVNGVTFKKLDDGGYSLSGSATGTASAYIYNGGAWLGDGDTITVSIYGSTKGTRIRVSLLKSDNSIIGSLITLDDDKRSATINKSDYPDAAKMNIVFAITAGTVVSGNAYIMVVNGDTPVKYYPYEEDLLNNFMFPDVIKNNNNFANASYVDFGVSSGTLYDGSGNRLATVAYAQGANFIAVEGAGTLTFVNAKNAAVESSITYQEGDYVFE